ncbi:hypothetical protein J6590_092919 [Homalodisca vitripennis]|nr:hypothetical protein J6590_092919 [Homalodisca vitripennis]
MKDPIAWQESLLVMRRISMLPAHTVIGFLVKCCRYQFIGHSRCPGQNHAGFMPCYNDETTTRRDGEGELGSLPLVYAGAVIMTRQRHAETGKENSTTTRRDGEGELGSLPLVYGGAVIMTRQRHAETGKEELGSLPLVYDGAVIMTRQRHAETGKESSVVYL